MIKFQSSYQVNFPSWVHLQKLLHFLFRDCIRMTNLFPGVMLLKEENKNARKYSTTHTSETSEPEGQVYDLCLVLSKQPTAKRNTTLNRDFKLVQSNYCQLTFYAVWYLNLQILRSSMREIWWTWAFQNIGLASLRKDSHISPKSSYEFIRIYKGLD